MSKFMAAVALLALTLGVGPASAERRHDGRRGGVLPGLVVSRLLGGGYPYGYRYGRGYRSDFYHDHRR